MEKIKANCITIRDVMDIAKQHFPEDDFKFFWNNDDLCLYFKEGVDVIKATTFYSIIKNFTFGLSTKFKIVDSNSDFWK